MTPSWQLRAYKVFARLFQKPLLALVRPQSLARKLFTLNAIMTHERPKGVRTQAARVGSVDGVWVETEGQETARVMLFVHGGAFVIGSVRAYRTLVARIGQAAEARAFVVDYRLAPEHPYPAALNDVVAAYRGLLAEGHAPGDILVCGDSAGGCLILALLHVIGEEGLPMPARVAVMSPVTDLRMQNPSLTANARKDPLIAGRWALRGVQDYLAGQDPAMPRVSPILGKFEGCSPILFQVGSDEVLLDDTLLMAAEMKRQGVDVTLKEWPEVPHVWHFMSKWVPEADAGIAEIGGFLRGK